MQIQCPSCRARTDLADHHEGQKVRCSECGHLHVARPTESHERVRGARRARLLVASLAAIVLAGVVFSVCARGAEPVATATRETDGQSRVERPLLRWYKELPEPLQEPHEGPTHADQPEPEDPAQNPHPPDQDR